MTVKEGRDGFSLTLAPKKSKARTYKAATRAAFKEKYPKLYKKYVGD